MRNIIIDDEIRIKYKIKKKLKLYFILDNIQENIENYDKKEDD